MGGRFQHYTFLILAVLAWILPPWTSGHQDEPARA
jgi:hypothetical protein